MTFNPVTEPIDYVLLANQRSPGLAVLSNVSSPRRWDERKGYALSGARVVFRGIGLARPLLTLRLLSVEDWDAWHEWRSIVERPPVGQRGRLALDIWHPILEDLGITKVVIEDVLQPKQVADGEWNIEIKMIEFRKPVRRLQTADAAKERPTDPGDVTIENLTAQVQANGSGSIYDSLAPLRN